VSRGCNHEELLILLEQAFLIQQKRVWSFEMLEKLERGQLLSKSTKEQRERMRACLEGNLRTAKVVLDDIAKELGYTSTIHKLLDPAFVYGAPGQEVPQPLLDSLARVETQERESGTQHLAAMVRELQVEHEAFLADVQERIREDVDIQTLLAGM
jgi:hypothetical protein